MCYFYSAPVTCLIQFSIFQAVWPHSGHYRPTEANFREFMNYLKNRNVDLTNVKVKKQIRVLYHLSPGTKTYLHCPFFFWHKNIFWRLFFYSWAHQKVRRTSGSGKGVAFPSWSTRRAAIPQVKKTPPNFSKKKTPPSLAPLALALTKTRPLQRPLQARHHPRAMIKQQQPARRHQARRPWRGRRRAAGCSASGLHVWQWARAGWARAAGSRARAPSGTAWTSARRTCSWAATAATARSWWWCRRRRSCTASTPRWACTRTSSGTSSRSAGPPAPGPGSGASGTTRRSCSSGRWSRSACLRGVAPARPGSARLPGRARAHRSCRRRPEASCRRCTVTVEPGHLRPKLHGYGYVYQYPNDTDTRIRQFPKKPDTWIRLLF